MGGAITTLGPFRTVRNLCARSGQKSILCHLCMDRGNVGEKQRAFGTETRTVRVSVPRRRGLAGPRCPCRFLYCTGEPRRGAITATKGREENLLT